MYDDYVNTVSSSSQCTPICPGNHPPYTPDSEKNIPLPSPLQQLLHQYISVHSNETQQFVVSTISFGWKSQCKLELSRLPRLCISFCIPFFWDSSSRNPGEFCGEGQMRSASLPGQQTSLLIPFPEQAAPWCARGDSREIVVAISNNNNNRAYPPTLHKSMHITQTAATKKNRKGSKSQQG